MQACVVHVKLSYRIVSYRRPTYQ